MFFFSVIIFNKNCNFFFSFLIWGSKILFNLIEIISFNLLNLSNWCLNFNHLPFNCFWIVWNIYSMLQCHILVQMYSFLFINGYCKVTGLVKWLVQMYSFLWNNWCLLHYWNVFEQAKGRLHRWDFETEGEWATYNGRKKQC